MKKYWIIVDGQPKGPFSASELKVRRDFTAGLPVWTNELPDWTTVGALPELAMLLPAEEESAEPQPMGAEPQQQAPVVEPAEPIASGWIPGAAMAAANVATARSEGRPKSFMGWNIAMLFCCCLVGGVVGLIFGSQVNSRWERGDVEGARKASEAAEWCVILSIVLGLVAWPFQLIFSIV